MKNKPIISILDRSSSILANIEASLLSFDINIICCTDIEMLIKNNKKIKHNDTQNHIIIANSIYIEELLKLNINSTIIIYGHVEDKLLPSNFLVLNVLASIFDVRNTVEYLLTTNTNNYKKSEQLQKLQTTVDKKIAPELVRSEMTQNKSFYVLINKKSINYVYAFIEYLYKERWISSNIRFNMYAAIHEIVDIENSIINNINSLIFTHRNGGYYLSVEYNTSIVNRYLLYILGFQRMIDNNQVNALNATCREVLIKSI